MARATTILLILLLVGCGQKGALYLPDDDTRTQSTSQQTKPKP
ncbi:MAG: lipoprotein [Gammaproteobacteria bacterium]|nr:lipoprotein [Gammaproteobacteria bacterium]